MQPFFLCTLVLLVFQQAALCASEDAKQAMHRETLQLTQQLRRVENHSPRIVLILSTQRCGTNMLEDWFESSPSIVSESEVILQHIRAGNNERKDMSLWSFLEYKHVLLGRMQLAREAHRDKEAVVFTIMYGQGSLEFGDELAELCAMFDIPVLHLLRRNKLRMTISRQAMRYQAEHMEGLNTERGQNRGHAQNDTHLAALRAVKPTIKTTNLVERLTGYEHDESQALRQFNADVLRNRIMVLYYEELVGRLPMYEAMVLTFLGLKPRTLGSKQLQLHPGPISSVPTSASSV